MEIDVDQIFEDDFKLRKEREKIDNSQEVKAKGLNRVLSFKSKFPIKYI